MSTARVSDVSGVTVIIPNHASTNAYLPETIASVVGQSVPAEAIVVVNDVHGRGPAWARNEGARQACTKWLLLLDADDTIHPKFIETVLSAAASIQDNIVNVVVPSETPLTKAIYRDNYLPYCCLVRRTFWLAAGGHQEPSTRGLGLCDWDWWIRLWMYGYADSVARIDPSLFTHRDRPDSMSKWDTAKFEAMRADLWAKYNVSPTPDSRLQGDCLK